MLAQVVLWALLRPIAWQETKQRLWQEVGVDAWVPAFHTTSSGRRCNSCGNRAKCVEFRRHLAWPFLAWLMVADMAPSRHIEQGNLCSLVAKQLRLRGRYIGLMDQDEASHSWHATSLFHSACRRLEFIVEVCRGN